MPLSDTDKKTALLKFKHASLSDRLVAIGGSISGPRKTKDQLAAAIISTASNTLEDSWWTTEVVGVAAPMVESTTSLSADAIDKVLLGLSKVSDLVAYIKGHEIPPPSGGVSKLKKAELVALIRSWHTAPTAPTAPAVPAVPTTIEQAVIPIPIVDHGSRPGSPLDVKVTIHVGNLSMKHVSGEIILPIANYKGTHTEGEVTLTNVPEWLADILSTKK